MIEFKIEEVNAYRRHIHFSIEAELVNSSLSDAYTDLKKNARIQGFRKGHVPTRILKKKFWNIVMNLGVMTRKTRGYGIRKKSSTTGGMKKAGMATRKTKVINGTLMEPVLASWMRGQL